MSTYNVFELGRLDEKDFSPIAWLNNALRRRNVTENCRQLEEDLLAISQSCMYTINDYNEQIESGLSEIGGLMERFIAKNEEHSRLYRDLSSRIGELSSLVNVNEEKYHTDSNIESILSLFEKKEKLEVVSQILADNSKFESLLSEIESLLQDKDAFLILIKEQGQDFQEIIDKMCSLRILVGSLESIPEFSARIERYRALENNILHILDDFFQSKFINESSEEDTTGGFVVVYSKFGSDSRLYKKTMAIIQEQIEQVWRLLWSLTTFGSQNKGSEADQLGKLSRKHHHFDKASSIIFLPAIEDLESFRFSQEVFRIREDEAVDRFFSWFSELISSRGHIIYPVLSDGNVTTETSESIQAIIKRLLDVCIPDVQEFIKTVVGSITCSKFIFPENNSEGFEMEPDSIFEMDHDPISTVDIKEIRGICERMYKSVVGGLDLLTSPGVGRDGQSNMISDHLNQDHFAQISNVLLVQGNLVQSLLLCDVAWIFQSMKNISSNLKSLIINQSPVSEYSSEIESKVSVLADRVEALLSNERFGDSSHLTLIPLEEYLVFFISAVDYSLRFFLENDLIYLLNPIQSSVRTQTLNLIKSIGKKQTSSVQLLSANVLDKELLTSCFAFHFSLMKTKQTFCDLLLALVGHCRSIVLSSVNDHSEHKSLIQVLFHDKISFNQYLIFQRVQETVSDSLASELRALLRSHESSDSQTEFLSKLGSQLLISQILSDSVDIISQCCSYPTLAFFEGYNRLSSWAREDVQTRNRGQDQASSLKSSTPQSEEDKALSLIESSGIQPCGPIVSIGEYLLNIVVTLESTCNSSPEMQSLIESENLIPVLVKKVSHIVEDTYRRQIIEIEHLSRQGCLQLYVDSKYILNIFEILLLYHKGPEPGDSNIADKQQDAEACEENDIMSLNQALLMIISDSPVTASSRKGLTDWHSSLRQKLK
ncbi:hypothetical protein OJ252_3036 [Cryptosporidium canis]|uniref:Conserved oligomeric Golgi complex subunit 7 n=1 Tax=Cryptosporidium canis TaxID=195482 RepID=A0ABQ8P3K2_9CRYT|nr:hypothetical protein OJ252_3036 [Cryptosporidium canis]